MVEPRSWRWLNISKSNSARESERRDGGEVERVETLHRRKAGGTNAALERAPFTIDEFRFSEAQEEAYMIELLARGLGGDLFILAQEGAGRSAI